MIISYPYLLQFEFLLSLFRFELLLNHLNDEVDLLQYNDSIADYLLLDSGKGSGKTFDWGMIRKDLKKEFFLAGGLDSENVTLAVDEFDPYAVDLSSSLETDGFKDEIKIKEIMEVIN